MKKLLIIAASTAGILAIVSLPAAAQFYVGADRGGVGVEVGPFGAGVGPRYGWRDRYWRDGYYSYGAADCRIYRERVVTPSGRVIVRSHRVCD